ncbi:hypothetical protein [Rhodococcus qingshengii]|nr:hypothetical protein [Rhodococcus qingshengii]
MKSTKHLPGVAHTVGSDRSISGIGRSVEQGPNYLPNPVFFPRQFSFDIDTATIAVVLA